MGCLERGYGASSVAPSLVARPGQRLWVEMRWYRTEYSGDKPDWCADDDPDGEAIPESMPAVKCLVSVPGSAGRLLDVEGIYPDQPEGVVAPPAPIAPYGYRALIEVTGVRQVNIGVDQDCEKAESITFLYIEEPS